MNRNRAMGARERERRLLHRLDRRRTLVLSAVVGVLAGIVAVGFRFLVHGAEALGRDLASGVMGMGVFGWLIVALGGAILGGLAGLLTEKLAPEAGGSGIPHVKAVLAGMKKMRPLQVIFTKMSAGLLALTAGMSLGREGPTIHLGAAAGSWFGRLFGAPRRSRRSLVAAGAGAGLAAAFNAPLAGFLFVMEELRREMTPLTYGTALIASVSAVAVARFALGQESAFALLDPAPIPLKDLPVVALVGVAAALVGVLFNRLLRSGIRLRERIKLKTWAVAATVGALTATLIVAWPQVTGGGQRVAGSILSGNFAGQDTIHLVLALLAAKLLTTVVSYSTGVPGGIFAPMLLMGALVGLAVANIASAVVPAYTPSGELMATIGMASLLSASVRAPLTGVVLIVEMTGQYHLLYALLVASFLAYALADLVHDKPIYEALLERTLHGDLDVVNEDGEVLEVFVEPDSTLEGSLLQNLQLPKGCLFALIERDGKTFAPHGQTALRSGDLITVVISPGIDRSLVAPLVEGAKAP